MILCIHILFQPIFYTIFFLNLTTMTPYDPAVIKLYWNRSNLYMPLQKQIH